MITMDRIKVRNKRLFYFFNYFFPGKIRLIGDINKPAVILNNKTVLSCYAHNFNLRLTDKPFKGVVVAEIKLQKDMVYDVETILSWYKDCEHRECFGIKLDVQDIDLYLSGYNFRDGDKGVLHKRYPVFSKFDRKIYFSRDKAEEISDELKKKGYKNFVV